jgi:hypothetical protein
LTTSNACADEITGKSNGWHQQIKVFELFAFSYGLYEQGIKVTDYETGQADESYWKHASDIDSLYS